MAMLVVTANWAIPDGSVAAPPRMSRLAHLLDEIRLAAVRAGVRHDGRYRPIERLVVVLAGDTIDGLVSGRWTDDVRPWHRSRAAAMRHVVVMQAAVRHARRPLAMLSSLARRGIAVPPADGRGRPLVRARVVVPVHVVVLAGDRDAALERLGGQAWSARRGIGIGSMWTGGGVGVTHGQACDPLMAGDDRPSLRESLAVDLLARFGAALAERPAAVAAGRTIVRAPRDCEPLEMTWHLNRMVRALARDGRDGLDPAWIIAAWRRSVDEWGRQARRAGCTDEHGEVAAIAAWMHAIDDDDSVGAAVREVMATLSAPLPATASRACGDRLTALGHPTHEAIPGPHVVCLGPRALRRYGAMGIVGSGVSCIETSPASGPASFPAVVIPEADEGGWRGVAWWRIGERQSPQTDRPVGQPILEAA
ncbi:MAG: hypothetical protein ACOVJ6_11190 [Pirellulales bacterium]